MFLWLPDRDREHSQRGVQPIDRHLREGLGREDAPLQRHGDGSVRSTKGALGASVVQPRALELRGAHRGIRRCRGEICLLYILVLKCVFLKS